MYCARHPATDAVRECARCGVLHCDACVRRVGEGRRAIAACVHCDGVLRTLDVRTVAPARQEAEGLARLPFTPTGLVTAGAVGLVSSLSAIPVPLVDLALGLLVQLMIAGTWYNVIDHVSRGKAGFPAPVEADGLAVGTLVTRGMLCLLLVFFPFGIWLSLSRGAGSVGELAAAHPAIAVALGLLGMAWLAAALLAMVVTGSSLGAYWPPVLVRTVALGPERYLRLLGLLLGSTAAIVLVRLVLEPVLARIPAVVSWGLVGTLTALAAFAQAALIGGYIRRHREVYTTR